VELLALMVMVNLTEEGTYRELLIEWYIR